MKKLSLKQIGVIVASILAVVALTLGILALCSRSWNKLSVDDFTAVSFDLYRMQGLLMSGHNTQSSDTISAALYIQVFEKHHLSQQDYDSTFAWYVKNKPEKLILMLQAVQDSLRHSAQRQDSLMQMRIQAENAARTVTRLAVADQSGVNFFGPDSIQFFALGRDLLSNYFEAPAAKGATDKARFEMVVRLYGLRDIPNEPVVTMKLQLMRDGRILSALTQQIRTNGLHRIDLPLPTEDAAYRIKASIRAMNGEGLTFTPICIDSLSLLRYD